MEAKIGARYTYIGNIFEIKETHNRIYLQSTLNDQYMKISTARFLALIACGRMRPVEQ